MGRKTLGDLVYETIEEYKNEKNISQRKTDKFRNSLEHLIIKHNNSVTLGSMAIAGLLGYSVGTAVTHIYQNAYMAASQIGLALATAKEFAGMHGSIIQTVMNIKARSNYLFNQAPLIFKLGYAYIGAGTGFIIGKLIAPAYTGKKLYSEIGERPKIKEKIGKLFRYPKTTAFGLTLGILATDFGKISAHIGTMNEVSKIASASDIAKNMHQYFLSSCIVGGLTYLAVWGGLSFVLYAFRDIEHMGKKGWKNITSTFRTWPIQVTGIISRDKEIKKLRKLVEKNNSSHLEYVLGRAISKKDIYEGLNYCKEYIEEIDKVPRFTTLKKWAVGLGYSFLHKKKDNWLVFFSTLNSIKKENSNVAKKVISKVRQTTPKNRLDIRFLLNHYGETYIKEPQHENWASLASDIIKLASEDKNIKTFQSSEGRVWVYTGSKLINRALVVKEYDFDFFERFLKQKFEYEALRNSEIKTENPLAFMKEDGTFRSLVTWQGDSTLAEYLRDKGENHKETVFKRIIYESLLAQKVIYDKAKKTDGSVYFDTSFGNESYSVKIEELDLVNQLRHRAFTGDERRGPRWGDNGHLDELMNQFRNYLHAHYHPLFLGICHGDLSSNNLLVNQKDKGLKEAKTPEQLTGKISRIDSRHWVTTVVYDPVHGSFSPCFNQFEREKVIGNIFESLQELYDFNNPEMLQENFNCLHPLIGTGLSAYYHAHSDAENAAFILKKVLDSSRDKPFIDKFWLCLKDSGAKPLLKII